MYPLLHRHSWYLIGAVLLFSCHHSPRDNPFDPALTPAVELQVALDDAAGTATLTWSRYEGQQPFSEYLILRNEVERTRVDTLVHIPEVEQTAYVDTTLEPNTAYVYRVAVVNSSGYATPSEEKSTAGYVAGPVSLVEVKVDEQRGEAQLRWSRYSGARFQGYRVERRRADEDRFAVIRRLESTSDTSWVDTDLAPEVAYFYQIVVEAAGQEWTSNPSGRQGFSLEPVQLWPRESAVDPQQGVLQLVWRQFRGPDFQAYQVRRRVSGTDVEQELETGTEVQDTTWVDSTLQHGVEYVYRVVVQAAGQELSSDSREYRLDLPAVRITQAQFDSRTASATLEWTRYQGPRFKEYQVVRRTAERAPQVVAEIEDGTATSYVDTGLVGNTEYFYQVVVMTSRGEEVESAEQRGGIHPLVGAWPLEVEEGEYVRLYWEGDHLAALVSGKQRVRLFLFEAQGTLIEEQVFPFAELEPRSVAAHLGAEGRRYVSAVLGERVGIASFGEDGQPLFQEHPFFADSLSALSGAYATVREYISITSGTGSDFFFDHVEVSGGGQVLFEEDFEGEPEDWDSIDKRNVVGGRYRGYASKTDEAWQDFYLEADVLFGREGGNIIVGNRSNNSFAFYLYPRDQLVRLFWNFYLNPGSSLGYQSKLFTEPFLFFPGILYRMGLGFREGQIRASVSSPLVWSGAREARAQWTSLAGIGQSLVLMHGDQVRTLSPEGEEAPRPAPEEQASEARSWAWEGRRGPEDWLGVCLPVQNQVLLARIGVSRSTGNLSWPISWSSTVVQVLGAGVGQGPGELIFPLSFDAGPDGRVFVLDAVSGRIQVFDREGKYLTQWGRKGSGAGEFDFGSGRLPEDFAGSVAVDDEGYIYVADVFNKRIQVFAP